jgi:hypothetical protein
MGGDRMHYEAILMNPPYSVGNKVTSTAIETCCKCVCLMPLGQYKSNNLYRHVESMDLADPKMFADADITKGLCICTIQNNLVDIYKAYDDMEELTFDKRYLVFYKKNTTLPKRYAFQRCDNASVNEFDFTCDFIESNRLPCQDQSEKQHGYAIGNNIGYNINILKDTPKELPSGLCRVHFDTLGAKDNFSKWAYLDKKKNNLANELIFGLSLSTVSDRCSIAIPQIDWEAISDTQLWKEGKYDEAVLDVMGLKWNDEKDGVVRRTTK